MGQIISLLTQFEVATVFAVTEDVLPTYQVLKIVSYLLYLITITTHYPSSLVPSINERPGYEAITPHVYIYIM